MNDWHRFHGNDMNDDSGSFNLRSTTLPNAFVNLKGNDASLTANSVATQHDSK